MLITQRILQEVKETRGQGDEKMARERVAGVETEAGRRPSGNPASTAFPTSTMNDEVYMNGLLTTR